ncbi:MAG TPA: c-type cytochrome [Usitatibacter sp.]|jgi:sulfide dehydrogenase cytochrome subunit|nr:c-type cytochrome [Usitatibacter sp.]
MIDRFFKALLAAALVLGVADSHAADGATVMEQCAACHGKNGVSTEPAIPTLAGYSEKYILDSLNNFKTKVRTCAQVTIQSGPKKGTKSDMCKVTADLGDSDAAAVAKYLADQKFVRAKQPFDGSLAAKGNSVYKLRCEKCHENNGSSPDEDNGILAGQWMPYLRDQIANFRAGKRPIDEKMKQRLDKVNKEEEEQLLHFFASQQQ